MDVITPILRWHVTRDARHVYQLPPTSQEHVRRGQVAAVAAQLAAVLPRVRRDLRHQGGQRVGRVPLPLLQTVTCCFSALISYAQFIRPTLIHKSLFSHQLETWEGKQSKSKENSSEITLIKYSATIRTLTLAVRSKILNSVGSSDSECIKWHGLVWLQYKYNTNTNTY